MVETEISKASYILGQHSNYRAGFLSLKSFLVGLIIFVFSSFRHNLDDNLDTGYVSLGMPNRDRFMLLSHSYK